MFVAVCTLVVVALIGLVLLAFLFLELMCLGDNVKAAARCERILLAIARKMNVKGEPKEASYHHYSGKGTAPCCVCGKTLEVSDSHYLVDYEFAVETQCFGCWYGRKGSR